MSSKTDAPWGLVSEGLWVAAAIAVTVPLSLLFLVLLYTVGGFGILNDLSNGLIGVLAGVLAVRTARFGTPPAAVATAGAGGALVVVGSWLVITGRTGWVLAGLVSGVGVALLGAWLVAVNRAARHTAGLTRRMTTLGAVTGWVMLLDVLTVPGVLAGQDEWDALGWLEIVGFLGWLGLYLGFPVWCTMLAREMHRQRRGA